jgi:hypothetical protein
VFFHLLDRSYKWKDHLTSIRNEFEIVRNTDKLATFLVFEQSLLGVFFPLASSSYKNSNPDFLCASSPPPVRSIAVYISSQFKMAAQFKHSVTARYEALEQWNGGRMTRWAKPPEGSSVMEIQTTHNPSQFKDVQIDKKLSHLPLALALALVPGREL